VRYWMSARLNRLRELFKASKQYVRDRPPPKWAFRVLYWSPLCVAFVHYGYTIKYISGRSMQVRDMNANFRCFQLTFFRARNAQPTLNPDSSLGKDLVLFDRVSTKIRHEYKRDDVVDLQYARTTFRAFRSVPYSFLTLSCILLVRRSTLG
jgi:inner membrane protease subunit 2